MGGRCASASARSGAAGSRYAYRREAFRQWLVETIPDQVADLRAVIEEWAPDVLVTDARCGGPSLVLHDSEPIPVALGIAGDYALIPGPDAPPPGSGLAPADGARGRAVAGR